MRASNDQTSLKIDSLPYRGKQYVSSWDATVDS